MNKEESKEDEKKEDNNDNEEESKIDPMVQKYLEIGETAKNELDALYKTINTFKLSTNIETEFKIQDKEFKISTVVSYSSVTKNRSDPMIWFTETICPGSPRMIYESWAYSQYRLKWDSAISTSKKIIIDDKNPNLYILNTATKPTAGGIISARDFVDLLRIYTLKNDENGYEALQIASKSIVYNDLPEKKGHVRGVVVLSGVLFEKINENELEEYKLPKLMISDDNNKQNECEWTRLRYIVQTDIKGWIPTSVINTAMSSTNVGMMRDLRNYIINQRLKLK